MGLVILRSQTDVKDLLDPVEVIIIVNALEIVK